VGRRQWGKALKDGQNLYFSPTSLQLADPESSDGCPRKWFFERVQGKKPPQTEAQKAGTELHSQIEDFVITGRNALGSLALRGMQFIPPPGPDVLVEQDIVLPVDTEIRARDAELAGDKKGAEKIRATASLTAAPLRAAGVPVTGYIDLVHARGVNYGVSDGESENASDPEGTVEVLDWKTTSKVDYIKSPEAMSKTLQMSIYGKWVTTCMPDAAAVRLSHVYFVTRGRHAPRKVSLRVLPEQIEHQWQRVERVGRLVNDVARETDPEKVEANTKACDAFGGCSHRDYCSAGRKASFGLSNLFDDDDNKEPHEVTTAPVNMAARKSLLGTKKPPEDPAAVKAAAIKIAREEADAKYPGIVAAYDELIAIGKTDKTIGTPTFGSPLAQIIGDIEGLPVGKEGGKAGTGQLSEHSVNEPADLIEFVVQLKAELSEPTVADPEPEAAPGAGGLLPPDAPASDPKLATSAPPEDPDPDAPEGDVAGAGTPATGATPAAAPVRRGGGRPKGSKNKPKGGDPVAPATESAAAPAAAAATPTTPAAESSPATATPTSPTDAATPASTVGGIDPSIVEAADGLFVYLGCSPSGPHEDLWELVTEIIANLNKRAGEYGDFRLVPNDHDLAYGRWKGLVAKMVRAVGLAGHHTLKGGAIGDVAPIVVETLRAQGGVIVS
jgi:hypothetical protein